MNTDKFATNPDVTGKIPVFEDNRVKLKLGAPETRDPIYTAMGSFITAYAREITVRAAQDNYETFAYADTDSLHLLITNGKDPEGLDVDPNKLGAWKFEYQFQDAIFVRAKTYIEHLEPEHWGEWIEWKEHDDGSFTTITRVQEHETHVAGLSVRVAEQLTIDTFRTGNKYEGNLKQKVVPGGIVLLDVGFKLPTW